MSVVQLRDELRHRGLRLAGNKRELVERLSVAIGRQRGDGMVVGWDLPSSAWLVQAAAGYAFEPAGLSSAARKGALACQPVRQKAVYNEVLSYLFPAHPEVVLARRIWLWAAPILPPEWDPSGNQELSVMVHRALDVLKRAAPVASSTVLKTWCNAWTTGRRFQGGEGGEKLPCPFCSRGDERLAHIMSCSELWTMVGQAVAGRDAFLSPGARMLLVPAAEAGLEVKAQLKGLCAVFELFHKVKQAGSARIFRAASGAGRIREAVLTVSMWL